MIIIGGITRLTDSGLSMVEWRPVMGFFPPISELDWKRVFALYKETKYWGKKSVKIDYSQIDQSIIEKFNGTHPAVVKDWLPNSNGLFIADPIYELTSKQKKHRLMIFLEKLFNLDLSKKHFKLVG